MEHSRSESDAAIMRDAQRGNDDAFAALVQRYQAVLVRVATSRLGRRDWAEEAAQETLLAAFRWRQTYDPARSFRTWLWTILLNQCTSLRKRQARSGRVANWSDRADDGSFPNGAFRGIEQTAIEPGESPLGALLARERADLLDDLLGRLTLAQADALRLRFFAGLKFDEIAEAMECSLLTAKNRVKHGLLRVAELARESSVDQSGADR